MLPHKLLASSAPLLGREIVPRYLTARDHGWLRQLLEQYRLGLGRSRRELTLLLHQPLAQPGPKSKRRVAALTLQAMTKDAVVAAVRPARARRALFEAQASLSLPRQVVVQRVAQELGVGVDALENSLFADLPSERRVSDLAERLSPEQLARAANLGIATGLVRRAVRLRLRIWGSGAALLGQARRSGLICMPLPVASEDAPLELEVSGPFTLFRHTQVYARALASLVPRLTFCERFELVAECPLPGLAATATFSLRSGDPIACSQEPELPRDRVGSRFARDFERAAPDWQLGREPELSEAERRLASPSFELCHRAHPERRFLLEIVGFWTARHLAERQAALSAAGMRRVILCADEQRNCAAEAPSDPTVVVFRKQIDPARVLASAQSIAEAEMAVGPVEPQEALTASPAKSGSSATR